MVTGRMTRRIKITLLVIVLVTIFTIAGYVVNTLSSIEGTLYTMTTEIKEYNADNNSKANTKNKLYLCPYCSNGLDVFSSSGNWSVAQLKCNFCEFSTPKITIKEPDAELKCIKKCKENFVSGKWTYQDIIGENDE